MPSSSLWKSIEERLLYEGLEISCALLYGSRAEGIARPRSDWDIFAVASVDRAESRAFFLGEELIELNLFPRARIEDSKDLLLNHPNDSFYTRLEKCQVLQENLAGYCQKLRTQCAALLTTGPSHLSPSSLDYVRIGLAKDFDRLSQSDPKSLEFQILLARFRAEIPQKILLLKKRWYRGIQKALLELTAGERTKLQSWKLNDLEKILQPYL